MRRILLIIICLSLSISISGCSTKAADVSAPDTTVAQTENNDGAAVEDEITETSGEQTSNPKPKVAAIPATEAGLYKAIGTCSELVIDPSDAQSSDPRVADGIAANVANCINDKFPQFYCGPIAMDDGSDGSLGDQVCTWKEYQVQGIRIIMTDEYTSAMQAAGSPYYP